MQLELREVCWFRNILDAAQRSARRVRLRVSSTGISWRALDETGVILLSVHIKRDAFTEFTLHNGTLDVGVDLKSMLTVMRPLRETAGDAITLVVDPACTWMTMSTTRGGRSCTMQLRCLTLDSVAEAPTKEVFEDFRGEYPIEARLQSEALHAMLENVLVFDDVITFRAHKVSWSRSQLIAQSRKSAHSSFVESKKLAIINWRDDECEDQEATSPEFSIDLIKRFTDGRKCCDSIKVRLCPSV